MTTLTKIALAAIALSTASFGSAAMAQSDDPVSKIISYSDLDLSTEEGQKRLETRLKSAARAVCFEANGRELSKIQEQQQCTVKAISSAKRDMQIAIAKYDPNNRVASNQVAVFGN